LEKNAETGNYKIKYELLKKSEYFFLINFKINDILSLVKLIRLTSEIGVPVRNDKNKK